MQIYFTDSGTPSLMDRAALSWPELRVQGCVQHLVRATEFFAGTPVAGTRHFRRIDSPPA
jgi:hypothetical protein